MPKPPDPRLDMPVPARFEALGEGLARDKATGLVWGRDANPLAWPVTWAEALASAADMNARRVLGRTDWRLPNRRELRSLVDHGAHRPALPPGHLFQGLVQNWYWTSTTSAMAPAYAWAVHFAGGRMFYARKDQYCLAWPCAGTSPVLARTGQDRCFDTAGTVVECRDTGQDGALRQGAPWPEPRFAPAPGGIMDCLTDLVWSESADLARGPATLEQARTACLAHAAGGLCWRLPTINELESLVDASRHSPALPRGHPFQGVRQAYWSATASAYEAGWAYCLYLDKGAVGVGFATRADFHVWPVARPGLSPA